MQVEELKKEVQDKIASSLTETNTALSVFEETTPTFPTPKDAIAHYKEIFGKLSITDLSDKDGYNKVAKAVSLCRTTRTTLEKMRKDDKAAYLEAGRIIDRSYNELIELIEPIEEGLKQKKEVVDTAIEQEKQRKEQEKQLKIEARNKQLIDLKFVFNGSGYQLRDCTVTNGEIQTATDEIWDTFVKGAATKAYNEQVEEEKEIARLKEQEAERIRIAERTERRVRQLLDAGFVSTEGVYVRANQSDKFISVSATALVSEKAINEDSDADFTEILQNAAKDTIEAKNELKAAQEAFEKQQRELKEKEDELKRQQEEIEREKQAKIEAELEQQRKVTEEAERKKQVEAEIIRLAEEKKKQEEAEKKRLKKEEKKKPEKQKLLEYAAKLEELEFPKLKELKEDGDVFRSRIADVVSDIRSKFGVEATNP